MSELKARLDRALFDRECARRIDNTARMTAETARLDAQIIALRTTIAERQRAAH